MDFTTLDARTMGLIRREAIRCRDAGRLVTLNPGALLTLLDMAASADAASDGELKKENEALGRLLSGYVKDHAARLRAERPVVSPKRQPESPRGRLWVGTAGIGATGDGLAGPTPTEEQLEEDDRQAPWPDWWRHRVKRGRG